MTFVVHWRNMNTTFTLQIDTLDNLGTTEFTDMLLHEVYPGMFVILKEAAQGLTLLEKYDDVDLLESILMRINEEFDEMYRKEKLVLFPYLLKLDAGKACLGCDTAFKNVKHHYTYILSLLQEAKIIFKQLKPLVSSKEMLADVQHTFAEFEVAIIRMYNKKEQYLFGKYSNSENGSKN